MDKNYSGIKFKKFNREFPWLAMTNSLIAVGLGMWIVCRALPNTSFREFYLNPLFPLALAVMFTGSVGLASSLVADDKG